MSRTTQTFTLTGADGLEHTYVCVQHGGIQAAALLLKLQRLIGVPLGLMWDALERVEARRAPAGDTIAGLGRDAYSINPADVADTIGAAADTIDRQPTPGAEPDAPADPMDDINAALGGQLGGGALDRLATQTKINGRLAGAAFDLIGQNLVTAGGQLLLLEILQHTSRDGTPLVSQQGRGTGFDMAYQGNPSEMIEAVYEVLRVNYGALFTRPPFVGRLGEIVSFMSAFRPSTAERGT